MAIPDSERVTTYTIACRIVPDQKQWNATSAGYQGSFSDIPLNSGANSKPRGKRIISTSFMRVISNCLNRATYGRVHTYTFAVLLMSFS